MKRLIAAWMIACSMPCAVHAQRWTTTESLRVKGPAPDSSFAKIQGMAVTPGGDFYVLDSKKAVLYRFAPAGEIIWETPVPLSYGDKGRINASVITLSNSQPIVVDVIGTHVITFDTAGSQLTDESFYPLVNVPTQWSTLGSSIVAVTHPLGSGSDKPQKIVYSVRIMSPTRAEGREITSVALPPDQLFDRETMTMGVNTSPAAILMESTGTRLFVADNQHYSISVFDTAGAKIVTLQRRVARKPVTPADRIRSTREVAHLLDGIPPDERGTIKWKAIFSDSLPAISQLVAGDSIVLVRSGSAGSPNPQEQAVKTVRWDVLGLDNVYRGYVDLPSSYRVFALRNRKVYGVLSTRPNDFSVAVLSLIEPNRH